MKKKTTTEKKKPDFSMTIPAQVLEEAGIADAKCAELHRLKHCAAVLQGRMTAFELVEAILSLNSLSELLAVQLSKACGACDGCGACADDSDKVKVPPVLLDELGIPRDAKLEAYADPDEGLILVGPADYEHDLSDIPGDFLKMLSDAGVCLGALEEHLKMEDVVYGD
jgi:hypothetical protein